MMLLKREQIFLLSKKAVENTCLVGDNDITKDYKQIKNSPLLVVWYERKD